MIEKSPSPFDMYLALSKYLESKGNISSKRLYTEMLLFAVEYLKLCGKDTVQLKELLRYDYLMSNQGRAPVEIERKYSEEETEMLVRKRKSFIYSHSAEKHGMFIPALEAHLFGFDDENVYMIDRKNRMCVTDAR